MIERQGKIKPVHVQVWKNRNELEQAVAQKIYNVICQSLKEKGRCSLALSGGETPKYVYHHLGQDEEKKMADWSRVHVFFCDERSVSPDHPDSNYGMINREWLSNISIPQKNIHRMKGELDPTIASDEYKREIRRVFQHEPVSFDLVLLGLGEDGHTASIFPETDAVQIKNSLTISVFVQKLNSWRLTLTVPILNTSREIIFLAMGKQKASIVEQVLDAKVPDMKLPATLIRPTSGNLTWMIDEEAGSSLKEHSSFVIEKF